MLRRHLFFLLAVPALLAAHAQDHVTANGADSVIPELRGDRPTPDRDLGTALKIFNGLKLLNDRDRSLGIVDRTAPASLRPHGGQPVIAEGVVLRTDAFLTPDLGGMVTVLTVLPSAFLATPSSYPPGPQRPAAIRRDAAAGVPLRPATSTLRFVLAGGTVYFDDNNGATVRQPGVRYPAPGESLIFFAETISGDNGLPSSVLLLTGACALQGRGCLSIDGSAINNDTLAAQVPGGTATALAFSLAGAPIADPNSEGIRGLAGSLESRYNLGIGDLRKQPGPDIPMSSFTPATADETFVRGRVLQSDASLTLGGLGVITHAIVGIDRILIGVMPQEHTMEIVQRGGLLARDEDVLLPALTAAQSPLVEGGDYFLTVGRTSDNRWELKSAWRVVDDQVFALDRSRVQLVTRDATSYWKSTDAFLKTLGMK